MGVFAYKASNVGGTGPVRGTLSADTPRQARDLLRARGLLVQEVTLHQAVTVGTRRWQWSLGRRHRIETVCFVRELSTLLAVGIPLLDALDTILKQHRGGFAAALLRLRERVAAGTSLAGAMREQPRVFDELCGDIAEVGENAGTLDGALAQLAEFQERSAQFKNRVGTALLYPCLVLLTGVAVSVFLMTFVVPNLLDALVNAGKPLPLATRLVKGVSDFLLARWWAILLSVVALVAGMGAILRTTRGRALWHRFQLKVPLLGDLTRKQAIVRIAVVMTSLLRSGVSFVRAIEVAQRTTRNVVLKDALGRFKSAVEGGRDIAPALEATGAFPPLLVQVFAVGQQSGRLEEMLERVAQDFDRQVAMAAQRLTAVLEPILILFLAVLVGLVAFATVLPILEAGNVF